MRLKPGQSMLLVEHWKKQSMKAQKQITGNKGASKTRAALKRFLLKQHADLLKFIDGQARRNARRKGGLGRTVAVAMLAAALFAGCTTTRIDPVTGATNRVPDVARTEQVKAVAEQVSRSALRRAVKRFPAQADQITAYARGVGAVFCDMQATKQFSPETLLAGIETLAMPKIEDPDVQGYVQDARDVLVLAYRLAYADRFNAELDPNKWPAVVAEIFCTSIDQGLKDAGRPGVK